MSNVKYGHEHVQVSHGCLATRQLWEIRLYKVYIYLLLGNNGHM